MAETFPINSFENPPTVELVRNNQGNPDVRCMNYLFQTKGQMGKRSANYRCSASRWYASLSLKTETINGQIQILQPIEITAMNFKHKDHLYIK